VFCIFEACYVSATSVRFHLLSPPLAQIAVGPIHIRLAPQRFGQGGRIVHFAFVGHAAQSHWMETIAGMVRKIRDKGVDTDFVRGVALRDKVIT
jgi:hypothetical protein